MAVTRHRLQDQGTRVPRNVQRDLERYAHAVRPVQPHLLPPHHLVSPPQDHGQVVEPRVDRLTTHGEPQPQRPAVERPALQLDVEGRVRQRHGGPRHRGLLTPLPHDLERVRAPRLQPHHDHVDVPFTDPKRSILPVGADEPPVLDREEGDRPPLAVLQHQFTRLPGRDPQLHPVPAVTHDADRQGTGPPVRDVELDPRRILPVLEPVPAHEHEVTVVLRQHHDPERTLGRWPHVEPLRDPVLARRVRSLEHPVRDHATVRVQHAHPYQPDHRVTHD